MNKYLLGFIAVLSILLTIFFFMWKGEVKDNIQLSKDLKEAQEEIVQLNNYNELKDKEIKIIQEKHNTLVNSYKGTDCENQKVSDEIIEVLKQLKEKDE